MIELRHVTHQYGDVTVLHDVSVCVTEPRVGVIGANGSGKSTLARLLNGLLLPTSGSVTVQGLDTREHGAEVRRQVGFIFSDPAASIIMPTVVEDIAFSLRRILPRHADAQARAADLASAHGLGGHLHHPAHLLSGGQKQMLAIAAATATAPQVVVADEPTAQLDHRHTRTVMKALLDGAAQVVLITHQLDLVREWDRVLVMHGGRLVADAPGRDAVPAYLRLLDEEA